MAGDYSVDMQIFSTFTDLKEPPKADAALDILRSITGFPNRTAPILYAAAAVATGKSLPVSPSSLNTLPTRGRISCAGCRIPSARGPQCILKQAKVFHPGRPFVATEIDARIFHSHLRRCSSSAHPSGAYMSLRSGDRARANKITRKRRLRRSQLKLLRKLSVPSRENSDSVAEAPAL
jgi:hypothetical protein